MTVSAVPASVPNAVDKHLAAEAESKLVMDVAKHAAERVHDIIKTHAMTLPTVSAAIGFGAVVCQQVYAETVQFSVNSMDGDEDDENDIRRAARKLIREVLDDADEYDLTEEISDFCRAVLAGNNPRSDEPFATVRKAMRAASAIEARRAATTSAVHESAGWRSQTPKEARMTDPVVTDDGVVEAGARIQTWLAGMRVDQPTVLTNGQYADLWHLTEAASDRVVLVERIAELERENSELRS